MTHPLSPAAQAVLDAFHKELSPDNQPGGLPAALRAAANRVAWGTQSRTPQGAKQREIRGALLAIAAELEGADG
jgi:hypothetical protein